MIQNTKTRFNTCTYFSRYVEFHDVKRELSHFAESACGVRKAIVSAKSTKWNVTAAFLATIILLMKLTPWAMDAQQQRQRPFAESNFMRRRYG